MYICLLQNEKTVMTFKAQKMAGTKEWCLVTKYELPKIEPLTTMQ